MSAPLRLVTTVTPERRRAGLLRDISVALAAHELTIRLTVPTLGNREAARTLDAIREKLDHQIARIETLVDEFRELAEEETE